MLCLCSSDSESRALAILCFQRAAIILVEMVALSEEEGSEATGHGPLVIREFAAEFAGREGISESFFAAPSCLVLTPFPLRSSRAGSSAEARSQSTRRPQDAYAWPSRSLGRRDAEMEGALVGHLLARGGRRSRRRCGEGAARIVEDSRGAIQRAPQSRHR